MVSWLCFLSFVGYDTYRERASGFGFFGGWLPHGVFRGSGGKSTSWGELSGWVWDTGSVRRFHSLFLPGGKDIWGVILLFFLTYPPHLDGGCLAGREVGRLEIPSRRVLLFSFVHLGGHGYLRESLIL